MTKPCTCHPDDNPPVPCPHKYALNECRAAAAPSPKAPAASAQKEVITNETPKCPEGGFCTGNCSHCRT